MLSLGGQSLEDKLCAVKYFISGQGISFVVLKATTSELLGPKKKHLNYLVNMTNEPNVSIPNLVKYLMHRARHPEWCVAFKTIITIHYLMSYGNEKFIQNLASSTVNHRSFDYLSSFVDRSCTQAYDMSTFLRRYSRYISVKIQTYRSLGIDFCKIKTDSNQSPLRMRNMQIDQLMTTLPTLQNQFDTLLAFDASAKDLSNGIINSAFSMLYKDFVKLYITYQTAIIRLLELYFTVNQLKRAQELLEAYKKFLVRMNKVSDFMRVIDTVGMDKSDMPNVSRSPSLSLKLLEKHLEHLESVSKRSRLPSISRIQSVELPKIEQCYVTLGRRRSLKAAASAATTRKDTASDFAAVCLNSPESFRSHKRRAAENRSDKVLEDRELVTVQDKRKKGYHIEEEAEEVEQTTSSSAAPTPIGYHHYFDDLLLADQHKKSASNKSMVNNNSGEEDLMIINNQQQQQLSGLGQSAPFVTPTTTEWVQVEL